MSVVCFVKIHYGKGLNRPYRTLFLLQISFAGILLCLLVPWQQFYIWRKSLQKSTKVYKLQKSTNYKRAPFRQQLEPVQSPETRCTTLRDMPGLSASLPTNHTRCSSNTSRLKPCVSPVPAQPPWMSIDVTGVELWLQTSFIGNWKQTPYRSFTRQARCCLCADTK